MTVESAFSGEGMAATWSPPVRRKGAFNYSVECVLLFFGGFVLSNRYDHTVHPRGRSRLSVYLPDIEPAGE